MTKPAFVVEGHMEQTFIKGACPKRPVRRIGCNGDQVTMEAMAKHLEVQIRLLDGYFPIVVIFDRERRTETCSQLRAELLTHLNSLGIDTQHLVIGIADRTIENWILADPKVVKNVFPDCQSVISMDGSHGKSKLRTAIYHSENYNETTTGVRLLKAMNPQLARKNSPSLEVLLSALTMQCWWLSQPA